MLDEMEFCTNAKYCMDWKRNQTIKCPLWKSYCGPVLDNDENDTTHRILDDKFDNFEDPVQQQHAYLCYYFQMNNSIALRQAIPGISSQKPIMGEKIYFFILNFYKFY